MIKLYSNEIVFRGHPDKVCDQIAGAILDACLIQDENSRVGVEVIGGKGILFITGEITTNGIVDYEQIARNVLADIGYDNTIKIINNVGTQSLDINQGVDRDNEIGAGDQGMMFGYATSDNSYLLPTAQVILQELAVKYDELRKNIKELKPDGKAQITGEYKDGKLVKIKTFTISFQNKPSKQKNFQDLRDIVVLTAENVVKRFGLEVEEFLVNPTGKFEVGGFDADAGVGGRKIVVDAYQSFANVGGGNMNGKDATKVDVSGAYKARQVAKRFVLEKGLKWCEIQVSYAIGISKPLAIYINSNLGEFVPPTELYDEFRVERIINDLELTKAVYEFRARYGHFGYYTKE